MRDDDDPVCLLLSPTFFNISTFATMVGAAAPLNMMPAYGLPFANALSTILPLLPNADRTNLHELSLSDMRSWSAAKADEYHRYTIAFNAIQNILAPIHRLPPEILSRIFVEAWQDRRSLRFTHVCRLWRTLLLETSEFWAVAIAGDEFLSSDDRTLASDEDYLDAACLRSAPRHISLRLWSISSSFHLQMTRHADRITSMHIFADIRDQLMLLWKALHTGMPHLETLAVSVFSQVGGWPSLSVPLSTEQLPLLTRLTLPARLFHSWPKTLREILVRSDHAPFMVTLEAFLSSFGDYPRLRVLHVRDYTLNHVPHPRSPSPTFPMLELLRIKLARDTVSGLLSLLTFPSSTRVDIRIVRKGHPRHGTNNLFFPDKSSALLAVVSLIDQVTIHSGLTSTIRGLTSGTGGAERLCITANFDEWNPNDFERAIRLFAPASRLLFAEHPAQRMCTMCQAWRVFSAFAHLTHLALHGRTSMCADVLEGLRPLPNAPLDGVLPPRALPCLKDLTVGLATKRHSEVSRALRHWQAGDPDVRVDDAVATHFRECCRLFPGFLEARRQLGHGLSRLEVFSYEEGCMGKPDSVVSHVDLAARAPGLVEREIEPLRGLVDGPVVFSGYRFFADA
ncbi:hypothetical protein V8D89_004410 [Ganoderma adspersum]